MNGMSGMNALFQWLPMGIALLAGAVVPLQAASNAALGRALGHPLWATMASLLVSMLVVIPLLWGMRASMPRLGTALAGPWWLWLGGVVGVAYLTAALMLVPKLGAANFMVCVVAGQMLAALLIDQYGLLGMPVKPLEFTRIAGVTLILLGMLLVQSQREPSKPHASQTSSEVRALSSH